MKTHKNLFQEVCKYKTLYQSYLKAKKGKNKSPEVISFTYDLEDELFNLQYELENQIYKTGEYRHFTIFEPKERKISALPFRDRVVHHAIYSVIEPIFENKFIYDSYACRRQKGTHAGANKLQKFIRQVDENYYVLKCDVSKYFKSVNQKILKKIIREKIADKKLLNLLDNLINSVKEGIPIGNLTSQIFANIYLNKLDEYIKHELGLKYYLRYMDDFIILHESKQELWKIKQKIKLFFILLKLTLHPKKANIFPVFLGVDFLGYRIFNNHRLVRKSTVKRFLKNIKNKMKKYDVELIKFDKIMESLNSWEAYLSHGDSYNLKKSLYGGYLKNVM